MNQQNELPAHMVRAIRYRFIKVNKGSGAGFGSFGISAHTRTPAEIIHHMFDLAVKTTSLVRGGYLHAAPSELLDFNGERDRLLAALEILQRATHTAILDETTWKKIIQGPLLDITTHIGQIALLNGLHGNKIQAADYYNADLTQEN
ncbi:hypothetical protein LL912_23530 [Niabella sp. CC-SYL272]|uniref:hypothetical protein n=1 Tax=Niabella agricola TaxID=2891571 RepID=UPI001F17DAF9|nr:hypothetical protein [Niabella agricola]MCF3111779.1 hypothetical protein [Niabella agricola]